jgi:ABC transport system ATP-binding/permease protein
MSNLVTAGEVVVKMGREVILDHVGFGIEKGEKVVIVGRNGSGKTTLMKVLAGLVTIDEGEIHIPRDLRTGYLSQSFDLDLEATIHETLDVTHPIIEQKEIAKNRSLWSRTFGLPNGHTLIKHLSGGQQRRLALTKSLLLSPDLLLLDEPTNHLDLVMIQQLETIINTFPGTCVIISHDRYFVDNVGTTILEIDNKKIYTHSGGFTDYLWHKDARIEILEKQEERRQDFLDRELEWVHAGVKARGTKNKGRLRQYFEIKNAQGFKRKTDPLLLIPPATEMGSKIVHLKHLGIEIGDKQICEDINLRIEEGYRIGIIGANGSGKTTFIKTLLGLRPPTKGKVVIGEQTEFVYQDQDRTLVDEHQTIMYEISGNAERIAFGESTVNIWGYLKRYLFSSEQITSPIEHLSGGEKARVVLAKLFKQQGNFMVLDEPTNDLDLEMLGVLEESLVTYSGCMLVVSHDRYFLNRVCTHIIALDGLGGCLISTGNYDDYIRKYGEDLESAVEVKNTDKEVIPSKKPPSQQTNQAKKIEKEIGILEREIVTLKELFKDPQAYLKHGASKLMKIQEELTDKTRELDEKMLVWLEVQER